MDGRLWPFGVSANLLSVGSVPPKLGHYDRTPLRLKTMAHTVPTLNPADFASHCTECPACVRDGRLWYGEPDAIANAIGYAKFARRL
jgi:hypothetical protein